MGTKGSKKIQPCKVLALGVSGSGKTTFIKQMKIIHGGFTPIEVQQFQSIVYQNIVIGIQELIRKVQKLELPLEGKNEKFARSLLSIVVVDAQWDSRLCKKVKSLWSDPAVQQVWTESPHYQFQVTHMEFLMHHVDRFSDSNFVPTNEDILVSRQRTTGTTRTVLKKDRLKWELIDIGGQVPERLKWEEVMIEGMTAVIFFAGLDEFNMASAENKSKNKMEVAMDVFKEVMNAEPLKGVTKILFLNKVDLFQKKISDENHFKEFQHTFPDYQGNQSTNDACSFVCDKFRGVLTQDAIPDFHVHVVCALDTASMSTVFQAVTIHVLSKRKDL